MPIDAPIRIDPEEVLNAKEAISIFQAILENSTSKDDLQTDFVKEQHDIIKKCKNKIAASL